MSEEAQEKSLLEKWDELGLGYGDFISHADLDTVFMTPRPFAKNYIADGRIDEFDSEIQSWGFKRLTIIDALRNDLLEKRMTYLVNVRAEGYLLAKPKDQISIAATRFRNTIAKASDHLCSVAENVNLAEIEDKSVRARVQRQQDAVIGVAVFVSGSTKSRLKLSFEDAE